MKLTRLVTHVVVFALAIFLWGVRISNPNSSSDLHLAPIGVTASDLVDGGSGIATSLGVGRKETITKPVAIPAEPVLSHRVVHYAVRPDDTVALIAQQHGIPEESVRWSNLSRLSRADSEPESGIDLLLPPVAGIALVSQPGDKVSELADRYHVEAGAILDFNRLSQSADDAMPAGLELVVPAGRGP